LKTCLPDINVWIALASDRHVHHDRAKAWFAGIESAEATFCRITQMGFLRLITNTHVMGADVATQKQAWKFYEALSRDERVTFMNELPGIDEEWRKLTQSTSSSTNAWTDAYLAAFASVRGLRIISFDGGFKKLPGIDALIL
jgi:toxin-antitoxin system PIN domain toxin